MGIASLGGILSGAGDVSRPNTGQATDDFAAMLNSYLGQSANLLGNEQQYKPQYAKLNTGLFNNAYRSGIGSFLPATTSAMRSAQPGAAGLMDTLGQQAQEQLKLNGALDPATLRSVQQGTRSSQAARGLGYGPGDAAQEQFYQTQTMEQRRAQNQTLAESVAHQGQSDWGLPALSVAASGAAQSGQAALGASPSLAPQNMSGMLLAPYQASLQQNLATAQNNTGLYESMDKNSTSLASSAMSSL